MQNSFSMEESGDLASREKALVHRGMKDPPGYWIAPPGRSNRSGVGAAGVGCASPDFMSYPAGQ